MISSEIDESEKLLILCSSSTKSPFSFWDLRFLVRWGEENTISNFGVLGGHNLALGFNILKFSLFPNGSKWFPLIKPILISDDSPIGSPN